MRAQSEWVPLAEQCGLAADQVLHGSRMASKELPCRVEGDTQGRQEWAPLPEPSRPREPVIRQESVNRRTGCSVLMCNGVGEREICYRPEDEGAKFPTKSVAGDDK